jgi:hypothetical protein
VTAQATPTVPNVCGDLIHAGRGILQRFPAFADTNILDVFRGCHACRALKTSEQRAFAQIGMRGEPRDPELLSAVGLEPALQSQDDRIAVTISR